MYMEKEPLHFHFWALWRGRDPPPPLINTEQPLVYVPVLYAKATVPKMLWM